MGQVWQATDQVLERQVAVKLLHPEYATHPATLSRFRSEARHTASLTHPCIAQVYDYGDSDSHGSPYLVMEFVDGPSLFTVLTDGPLSPAYAVDLTGQVAAVSCGITDGTAVLDLDYAEDSNAEADANFVLTSAGGIVEVQATAEKSSFTEAQFLELLRLARAGTARLFAEQARAVGAS